MLPFLKRDKEVGASSSTEVVTRDHDEDTEDYDALESAIEDLFSAFKSNDIKAGCAALRAAFELCDSEPHEEGPHV